MKLLSLKNFVSENGTYNAVVGNILNNLDMCSAVCVTTNTCTRNNGTAVMGAGFAKQIATRYPHAEHNLGAILIQNHHKPTVDEIWYDDNAHTYIVSLPTKRDWRDKSPLELVEQSLIQLVDLTNRRQWQIVRLPMPGIGLGGLPVNAVKQLLHKYLDERFHVYTLKEV